MPIRKVLLPLAGGEMGAAALHTALLVARRFTAHVHALHVRPDGRDVAPIAGDGLTGTMLEAMIDASEREGSRRGLIVRELFARVAAEQAVAVGPVPDAVPTVPGASLSEAVGREEDVIAQQARLADLTVVPHPRTEDEVSSSDALHAVLFDSGRPVLIAPPAIPASVGARVAVAWNGTAESATAVQTALPWLARADSVFLLTSKDYQRSGPAAAELTAYLALYGIRPVRRDFTGRDAEVGRGLLATAADCGADLLTMGAYSHSRLRQLILGGVTRHVLEQATLPVLMNR